MIVCHEVEYPAPKWPVWRPEKLFDRLAPRVREYHHGQFAGLSSEDLETLIRLLGVVLADEDGTD